MVSTPPALEIVQKDVFISYNKADEEWARDLAARIERETIDGSAAGEKLSTFFAPWDIELGPNFVLGLSDGLRKARCFAPVLSPEFFAGPWPNFEWTDQVALDPTNATGRILPLFLRDVSIDGQIRIELPPPFTTLNRLDFRRAKDFDSQFAELIRVLRGWPKPRGVAGSPTLSRAPAAQVSGPAHSYAFADPTPELLVSNLLPLSGIPESVWSGETTARKPSEIWEQVRTTDAFILRDKRLFTFTNLADELCPLRRVIDPSTVGRPAKTSDWIANPDSRRNLVALLNECLKQHARERFIGKDEKGRFYFWPSQDRSDDPTAPPVRQTRMHRLPGETRPRAVAAKKLNPADQSVFWVHYAARVRVEILGTAFFLRIEPTYIFTKDGREPLDGKSVGRLSIQWSGKQQNPDVLRAVLFWCHVLSDGQPTIRIAAGGEHLKAAAMPAIAGASFGVVGDYIRVAALVREFDPELDDIVAEAEVVQREGDEDSDEDH